MLERTLHPKPGLFAAVPRDVHSSIWNRLLPCFPHGIAKNKRWPADKSSVCFRKCMLKVQAVIFFFKSVLHLMLTLWLLSQGNVTWQVPICCGCDHIAGSACWWHWALMLCLEQRLHCDPAWCCQVLCCHMQRSQLLWWGIWKPVQDSWVTLPGESPQSTPCLSGQSLDCLLLSDLGWSVFWCRPVHVGSSGWPKCGFHEV